VLLPGPRWLSACLSTQSGCPVGCGFCASGGSGFSGDLPAGEIVEQLLQLQVLADARGERISHLVLMGMGEPLLNYDNTLKAIRIINSPAAFNIGARHITLSTVGLPREIRRLADEGLQLNLAISLHSADQAVRQRLIPFARIYPLPEIVAAARFYFERTGREPTLEYLLLAGVNDAPKDAEALARLAKELRANVNLIAYNPTPGEPYAAPPRRTIALFQQVLEERNVTVHLRASKGADIDGACGQLRRAVGEGPPDGAEGPGGVPPPAAGRGAVDLKRDRGPDS